MEKATKSGFFGKERFTFPSSNPESPGLSSLLEEEGSTSEPKEELLETSALLGTSKQTPSDENLSNESKNELPTEENNSIQNYQGQKNKTETVERQTSSSVEEVRPPTRKLLRQVRKPNLHSDR
ncbi:hypothetical protein E2C01_048046 [Portunus trituberculatus]|uniref:Uncharacterized protein n=1 Tax=Portunus trituberculatus TaxID=210409 RepID=A0A5B7G950_PORTR|nr:hypothetical protein [Portunus trituberculatus]